MKSYTFEQVHTGTAAVCNNIVRTYKLKDFLKGEDDPYRGPKKKKLFYTQNVQVHYESWYAPVQFEIHELIEKSRSRQQWLLTEGSLVHDVTHLLTFFNFRRLLFWHFDHLNFNFEIRKTF